MASDKWKKALGIGGKVVATGLQLGGAVLFGAPGAAIASVPAAAIRGATTTGDSDKKKAAALKQLAIGGAITAGTLALGLGSGAGATAPLTSSIPAFFGGSASPQQHQEMLSKTPMVPPGAAPGSNSFPALPGYETTDQNVAQAGQAGGVSTPILLAGAAALFLLSKKKAA